eukprot:jgi/Chrzof1/2617/Cz11g22180.t1
MGSGRDKKKKAKERKLGPAPGKGTEKTEKKTERNETKKQRRVEKKLEGDEDNIDAILAKFAMDDKAQKQVTIQTDCAAPTARVNASFVRHVTPKSSDVIMFGGEYSDLQTDKVYVNNDLYIFNCDKRKWTQVSCPHSPTPRCAHQAVIYKGSLYVWGGEFSSPNQERFVHFRDLWRLSLSDYEWDQLPVKGGPSARSGHRMVLYKNKAILFGGFYDTGVDVKYYNDLWELSLTELTWTCVGSPSGACPPARSGCQMVVHGDVLYMYGGYSKTKDEEDADMEFGKAHDDLWALDLNTYKVGKLLLSSSSAAPAAAAAAVLAAAAALLSAATLLAAAWERLRKTGMAPGARSSFGMVQYKQHAFLFGGVSDNEARGGEDLSSEFHNDLYQFNCVSQRWFAAELRPSKSQQQQQQQQQDAAGTSRSSQHEAGVLGPSTDGPSTELNALLAAGQDKGSAIYKAAVRIQSRFRGYVVRKAYKVYKLGGAVSEILYSPAAFGLDMSVRNMPKPRARISPQMCVVGNLLWLLGGIVEIGDKEITLDDMWCLDLAKLDGWQLVKENTVGEEHFKQLATAESSDDDEDDEHDDPMQVDK